MAYRANTLENLNHNIDLKYYRGKMCLVACITFFPLLLIKKVILLLVCNLFCHASQIFYL